MKPALCARCNQPFTPRATKYKVLPFTRCCDICLLRNFFDAMNMPSPPELLDRFTRNPTLTEEGYRRALEAKRQKGRKRKAVAK